VRKVANVHGFSVANYRENMTEMIRHMLEDNNKMNLTETRQEGVDWIDLAKERGKWQAVVCTEMENSVSIKAENLLLR
jgi:hypothetical protein